MSRTREELPAHPSDVWETMTEADAKAWQAAENKWHLALDKFKSDGWSSNEILGSWIEEYERTAKGILELNQPATDLKEIFLRTVTDIQTDSFMKPFYKLKVREDLDNMLFLCTDEVMAHLENKRYGDALLEMGIDTDHLENFKKEFIPAMETLEQAEAKGPEAFKTNDGYVFIKRGNGWTDGDMSFPSNTQGLPFDDVYGQLDGKLVPVADVQDRVNAILEIVNEQDGDLTP
ncbi:hypothetical protein [Neptuniibacter sp. QD37_11]|uniref:hypothetical protein n=1 Tax=Neptuniibacter sp. QD37_11 TaxID=3398209 RepID=UPI0039F518DD